MISLETLLSKIPKPLFSDSDPVDFLSWMTEALRQFPSSASTKNCIFIREFKDNRYKIEENIAFINHVYYTAEKPLGTFDPCGFSYLYYSGKSCSIIKSNVPNPNIHECHYGYAFDGATIYTDHMLKDGFLVIDAEVYMQDGNGVPMMYENEKIAQYLVAYAIYKHWEILAARSVQNAANMMQYYDNRQSLLYRKAKGSFILRGIDYKTIGEFKNLDNLNIT